MTKAYNCYIIDIRRNIIGAAITYENRQAFQYFGRIGNFKIYEIKSGEIKAEKVVSTNDRGRGALKNNIVICADKGYILRHDSEPCEQDLREAGFAF